MYRTVWVTFQQEGFHAYHNAPEEVSYLRQEHRHIFHFRVELEVAHDDREVEFHMLKNTLLGAFSSGKLSASHQSCEQIAEKVLDFLVFSGFGRMPEGRLRQTIVTVSEDGECGATVRR